MSKPPHEDVFDRARRSARDEWEGDCRNHNIDPSVTDAFTDGFWAARDWAVKQMLERFKGAPQHHDEIKRLLGVSED